MSRVLFVVIPEKGHINPYVAPAVALRERGHTIAFYSIYDVSEHLDRIGFPRFYSGQSDSPPPPDANRGREFAANVQNQTWLRHWIKNLLLGQVPEQVEVLQQVIHEFQPEVLVIDPMVYQGAIAAHLEGLPWVGISSSLNPVVPTSLSSELIYTNNWLAKEREELFQSYNTKGTFRVCDCLSPYLNIVYSSREFVGRHVPGVRFVGPSLPPGARGDEQEFPWNALSDSEPIVYMSLGSQIYYQPEMFSTVIEAVRGEPVQLILSVNELIHSELMQDLPPNVMPVYYAPQLALLSRVNTLITHGGANSVMEALAYGVPMLISPICNDQFHQTYFIKQSGTGIQLDLNQASPRECWYALETLLTDGTIRENCSLIKQSYHRNGGLEAALLVEGFLKERNRASAGNY